MFDDIQSLSVHFLKIKNQAYRRYFIKTTSLTHRLTLILGSRGIGKTVTLVQLLLDHVDGDLFSTKILYVPADHFILGNKSLYEIADHFQALGCEVIAFDEIHKYPDWSKELKSIYDSFPRLKIYASGSSALKIIKGSHDLARRGVSYTMLGLSFREFLEIESDISFSFFSLEEILKNHRRLADQVIDQLEKGKQKVLAQFQRYLTFGYYPYYKELPDEAQFQITLEQNVHATIESDLTAIYPQLSGISIQKIKKLLVFIAGAVPFSPHWQRLKDLVEVGDIRTLKTYFHHLESAGLIRMLSSASQKMSQVDSIEKIYLDNPNLYYAINSEANNKGTVRETFFLNMLIHSHSVEAPSNGDFLVNKKFLFEVGGKNKSFEQVKKTADSYLVCDDIEHGAQEKIPLWLFGFLY